MRRFFPWHIRNICDLSVQQVKVLLGVILLVFTTGCVAMDYSKGGSEQQKQAKLEKLVSKQDYHKALVYLNKVGQEKDSEVYKSEYQRITLLMEEIETDVTKKAASLTEVNDLLGAAILVEQALEKIPESEKLLKLNDSLRQERKKRFAENERSLLLSNGEHLISQLQYRGEQAKLEKPSSKINGQIKRMEKSLAALYPDLLVCGQQTIDLKQYDVAGKCLEMAGKINDSEEVNQLLARIDSIAQETEVVVKNGDVAILAETKKSKPAAVLASSFLELEKKLEHEIAQGELLKAYGYLAKLEKLPGKKEQIENYRRRLDKFREKRIATKLEEGSGLYRSGKISEARSRWQDVLALDPENQIAREKIIRADKVLKSIQDLQKTQQKTDKQ